MIKRVMKKTNEKMNVCNRCSDEKEVNSFGLCKTCQMEVDHEYGMLYSIKNMDY